MTDAERREDEQRRSLRRGLLIRLRREIRYARQVPAWRTAARRKHGDRALRIAYSIAHLDAHGTVQLKHPVAQHEALAVLSEITVPHTQPLSRT